MDDGDTVRPRMNLLHLFSDWFRNPLFRDRLFKLPHHGQQIEVLRTEYLLTDQEIGIVTKASQTGVAIALSEAILHSDGENPDEWQGVGAAVFRGNNSVLRGVPPKPASKKKATGWPGTTWVCIESVNPRIIRKGEQASLDVVGWNLDGALTFELQRKKTAAVVVGVRNLTTDGNGRSTFQVDVTLADAGTWDLAVKTEGAELIEARLPEALISI